MDASEESQPSAAQASEQIDPADCFKILLATDIHLGYKEKDPVVGMYTRLLTIFADACINWIVRCTIVVCVLFEVSFSVLFCCSHRQG